MTDSFTREQAREEVEKIKRYSIEKCEACGYYPSFHQEEDGDYVKWGDHAEIRQEALDWAAGMVEEWAGRATSGGVSARLNNLADNIRAGEE